MALPEQALKHHPDKNNGSETERAKLVYRVEAIPEDPARFHPGQPVQVRLDR